VAQHFACLFYLYARVINLKIIYSGQSKSCQLSATTKLRNPLQDYLQDHLQNYIAIHIPQ